MTRSGQKQTCSSGLSRRLVLGGLSASALTAALPPLLRPSKTTAAEPIRLLRAEPGTARLLTRDGPATPIWGYDARVPGPLIRLRRGDELRLRLDNALPQATTIHWHGIRIDNAMDGVAGLTQDAVAPGESFDYRFALPDAGTFWYHPHNRSWEQVARGLYGILIVEEPAPPRVDQDLLWVADDWRLGNDGAIHDASFGHMRDWSHAGRLGNILTINGQPDVDFPVKAGERVRLRLCNCANARVMTFAIEEHAPVLVAIDGQPLAPRPLADGRVTLAPGQRADVIIDMALDPGATAAIAEVSGERVVAGRFLYDAETVVRRNPLDAPLALPANEALQQPELAEALEVELLMEGGAMGRMMGAMHRGQRRSMRDLVGRGFAWAFNGMAGMTEQPLFSAPTGRTVIVRMVNDTRWPHAMHFHGHHFLALDETRDPAGAGVWRDTLLVEPQESTRIAFVADNPGRWMLHCHMLEHQAAGMATWFQVTA